MTKEQREQAARVLEQINYVQCTGDPTIDEQRAAVDTAITALREQGWVRTSERMPTKQDSPTGMVVNAWSYAPTCGEYGFMVTPYKGVEATANPKDYWMPLPPLPEADE